MNMRQRRVLLQGRKRPVVFKHKEEIDPKVADFLNLWVGGITKMIETMPELPKPTKAYLRWERNVEKAQMQGMIKRDPSYAKEFSQRGHPRQETADMV